MLQVSDYFRQFRDSDEITEDVEKNAKVLIAKVSHLLSMIPYEGPVVITSGFRPKSYNKRIGGSPNSHHCYGNAIDLHDPDETIGKWAQNNIAYLREHGLFMESLCVTHKSEKPSGKWVHFQIKAPKSGSQIFLP